MDKIEIYTGQVYKTGMIGKFTEERKRLGDIKILSCTEGFVIFERDGIKEALHKENFISTFIEACKYKLSWFDFDYRGYLVVFDNGEYVIGDPIGFSCPTAAGAMAVIDYYHRCDDEC